MNGHIIRYLALNGPSLIYYVAKDLASNSQTKVHYPTVNRRMHDLVRQSYLQKAGTRTTKAGIPADLYATTIRGDFAALAGMPESDSEDITDLSPREMSQMIRTASLREGSPFALLQSIIEQGKEAEEFVGKELIPEIIGGVRNGYLNLDASDEGVICSAFASLVSRKVTDLVSSSERDHSVKSREKHRQKIDILMRCLERTTSNSIQPEQRKQDRSVSRMGLTKGDFGQSSDVKNELTPLSRQWGNELKVFLKLHSVRFD